MAEMLPMSVAEPLCDELFRANKRRFFAGGWFQCLVCGRLTGRSCLESEAGCSMVNKLYRQRQAAAAASRGNNQTPRYNDQEITNDQDPTTNELQIPIDQGGSDLI